VVFADGDRRAVSIGLRYDDEASAKRASGDGARGRVEPVERDTSAGQPMPDRRQLAPDALRRAGSFAALRSPRGRDLGVTLGPYTRDKAATHSAATCATALSWAATIARGK
jgi:hypothetical protein